MENKQFNSEIGYIINKYIELILKSFNKYEEKRILLENYTTQTAMISLMIKKHYYVLMIMYY